MNPLKKLASQTAVYGLSSIVGRFLNYLLVPLHTAQFIALQYGIITEMYAYVAFLVVLLTYGMETAFFRFSSQEENDKKTVFRTAVTSVLISSAAFICIISIFSVPLSVWLKYPHHTEYVTWFAIIVGLDAITALPLAKLRLENKAGMFALVNLVSIAVNIGLNIFFIGYCMPNHKAGQTGLLLTLFYNPEIGVGYVFIANLIASIVKFLLVLPFILKDRLGISKNLLKKMLLYALPLLLAGLAGSVNETLDRIMLKRILWDSFGEVETMSQLGIYGACYKISIIITLFIQAFRYAAEPFFFSQAKENDATAIYSRVMTYFVIVCSLIFLGVMLYLDSIKHFLQNKVYWEGLNTVPILLFANIFLGIYFNLSIWYKLSGKTSYGAWFSIMGAVITVVLNLVLIPKIGYMGSAWTTLICYASMCAASYFFGQRNFYIKYEIKHIMVYLSTALALYVAFSQLSTENLLVSHIARVVFVLVFISMVVFIEKRKITIKTKG